MTPTEFGKLLNSPDITPHKIKAAHLVANLYAPGEAFNGTWYRDSRTEAVSLLLYFGTLAEPGTVVEVSHDDQVEALKAKLAQIAKIAGG